MKYSKKFLEAIEKGEIPKDAPEELLEVGSDNISVLDSIDALSARTKCTKLGMWAIVDLKWTKQLANWIGNRKCLEVMAGAGWLAKALSIHEIDIVATDNGAWEQKQHKEMKMVYPIEKLDAIKSAEKYQDRDILIVSWPPYTDYTICKVCDEWGNDKPIVYIGEGEGGCCAPESFWQNFKEIELSPYIKIPQWLGIHDYLSVGHWDKVNISEKFTNAISTNAIS